MEQDKSTSTNEKIELIVDTDGGIDDSIALIFALTQRPASSSVSIAAITTVFGNVSAQQATENMCRILDLVPADHPIPVYTGATEPIITNPQLEAHRWEGHGRNGLGDAEFQTPPKTEAQSEHAVLALVRMLHAHPGRYTLACLGPLTNVALALRMDSSIRSLVKKIVFMGGTSQAKGNVTPSAEFNIWADPEAAHIVINGFPGTPIYMVSWELTEKSSSLPWQWYQTNIGEQIQRDEKTGKWLPAQAQENKPESGVVTTTPELSQSAILKQFIRQITKNYERFLINQFEDSTKDQVKDIDNVESAAEQQAVSNAQQAMGDFVICDLIAMLIAMYGDSIVKRVTKRRVTIELGGTHTRGHMVIDWYDHFAKQHQPGNNNIDQRQVYIVEEVDDALVSSLWFKVLGVEKK